MLNITCEEMRSLCIKHQWFICGSDEQYRKLFCALESGCPLEEIVTIIWVCSDEDVWCRRDIKARLEAFMAAKKERV